MKTILIFIWVWGAMVAMSYWESYVEGRNAWDRHKLGWKIRITKRYDLTAYHFYLFCVMWPLLLTLPLLVAGWDWRLFGILLSAFFSGLVIEDFMWFVANPKVRLSEWNSKFANYYPWIKFGRFEIPEGYLFGIFLSVLSWLFLWR